MNGSMIQKSLTLLNFLLTEPFFSKLRNNIPLEKNYSNFRSLVDGGLTSKEALSKLELKQPPAT